MQDIELINTPNGTFQKATLKVLSRGDVIKANNSWRITNFKEAKDEATGDSARLIFDISQNVKTIDIDTGELSTKETKKHEQVLDVDGPAYGNVTYSCGSPDGKDITLAEKLAAQKIDLNNKHFVVTETAMTGGGNSGMRYNDVYPDGHHVTAVELDEDKQIKENGLVVNFYQTGFFNTMVKTPDIVGHMKPTFEKFKPV